MADYTGRSLMADYIASVGIYCYEKDCVVVESFKTTHDDWKRVLGLHSEFDGADSLEWLADSLDVAKKQLDNNDLQVDVVFTKISSD